MAGTSAVALLAGIALAALAGTAAAQDATWEAAPGSSDFNTDTNWTPATVPTGTAFFDTSIVTDLTFSAPATTIGGWTFNAGASGYTFTVTSQELNFTGAGIVVNGGNATVNNNDGAVRFHNASTAGDAEINNNIGFLFFLDGSTAGNASITNNSAMVFFDDSTAGNAYINNIGVMQLLYNSSAGNATIDNTGYIGFFATGLGSATITNNAGGQIEFNGSAHGGSGTIINNAFVGFFFTSTAGNAMLINNLGGEIDFSNTTGPLGDGQVSAGSIAGAGNYYLGARTLTVGGNGQSTEVSGVISDCGATGTECFTPGVGGSLVKVGTGTLTLSGVNTYTGGTTINSGTLALGTLADQGAIVGYVTVGGGGTFDVVNADTTDITTITSGGTSGNAANVNFYNNSTAGSAVIVNDNFSLMHFYDSSSAGTATITNNGGLRFYNNSTAGSANITNAEGVDFFDSSTAGDATITNNNGLRFFDTSTAGDAQITNAGLVLFDMGSGAGDASIINNFWLMFFDNSTAGNATITNNDTVQFHNTSTAGNATLINNLGGEIDFSAATGPAGDGQISAGSIAGAGNYYLGARTLTVGSNDFDTTVSGVISDCGATGTECLTPGTGGSLVKVGTGTLTLSGVNTYTGATTVNAGMLNVAATGSLVSAVTVNSGGRLEGIGTIGGLMLNNGGTLSPGNSIGTMTVVGNATFNAGSVYVVEVQAPNQADLLSVTGTATINGGEVQVAKLSAEASYLDGQTYRIVEAGTVLNNGDFTFANPFLFLSSDLEYGATYVDIVLMAGGPGQDFTTVAQTFNQFQAATALNDLEQSGDALAAYNELLLMTDADEARRAFDLSSGEIHASSQHVIDQTFGLFSRTLRGQASAGLGGVAGGQVFTAPLGYGPSTPAGPGVAAIDDATTSAYANSRVAQAWLAPLGGRGTIDADGNAAALNWWAAGLAGGYEGPIEVASGQAYAGFGLGYIRSHGAVDARLSAMDADGFHLGGYGGWTDGPWSLAGSLGIAANRISTTRRIVVGDIDRTATADYWSHTVGFSGEALYGFDMGGGTTLSPLATLDAGWSGHGGFSETGADALNLTGEAESWSRLDTGLGLALQHVVRTARGRVTLDGRAVWGHAFADVVPSQSLAFAGSPTPFEVLGPDAGRDRFRLGAGISFEATDSLTVRAAYSGLFSGQQHSHGGTLGLNVRF